MTVGHQVVLGKSRGYVEEFIHRDIVQFIQNIIFQSLSMQSFNEYNIQIGMHYLEILIIETSGREGQVATFS